VTQTMESKTINVHAMQWNKLDHISDVRPIDESDAACLEEVREVLSRHGALSRFGLALLHSHFELADDEMMMETTNVGRREHWVRPVKKAWIEDNNVTAQTTVVGFDANGYHQNCGCNPRPTGHHHL
jgi:hypothetical protein